MTSITRPRSKLSPTISAVRGGEGPHLVLIHGVGLSADAWYAMQPELEKHFTVTAIDLPGHGESAALAHTSNATLEDFTDAIAVSLNTFKEPVIVVGHSMGALISLDLAIRYSDAICAAIPLNTIYRRTTEATKAVKARASELASGNTPDPQTTLNRWFGDAPQGDLLKARNACRSMLQATNLTDYASAYRAFAQCDGPADSDLQKLVQPILCVTGEKEPNSTPQMSKALAALLQNGAYHIVENALHMMPITHAAEVNTHIKQFLLDQGLMDSRTSSDVHSAPHS